MRLNHCFPQAVSGLTSTQSNITYIKRIISVISQMTDGISALYLFHLSVFTFLSLDCPFFNFYFYYFFPVHLSRGLSCLSSFLPSLLPFRYPHYLAETHSDSSGLIFSRLIWLEHAKLINMGWSGLTYHFTICTYIHHTRTCSHAPPHTHTHIHT